MQIQNNKKEEDWLESDSEPELECDTELQKKLKSDFDSDS